MCANNIFKLNLDMFARAYLAWPESYAKHNSLRHINRIYRPSNLIN